MILITNKQRKIPINSKWFKEKVECILVLLDYADFDLNILLTTNRTIQKYNREYRGKDKPTDILSFPAHSEAQPGKKIVALNEDDNLLGDIIISLEYVQRKAPEWDRSFEEHLIALLVHGILHLLGYDHETDTDHKIMHKKELSLLSRLSLKKIN